VALTAELKAACASVERALWYAADAGRVNIVRSLLGTGADPNASLYRQTALHVAASHHHANTVKAIIGAGANVNVKNRDGDTPLSLGL